MDTANPWPTHGWTTAAPEDAGLDPTRLRQARDYAGGACIVTRHGRQVASWGDCRKRFDIQSATKSIGVTALGLAIVDGKVQLADPAMRHHPDVGVPPESNRETGWLGEISLLHLATMTAGFDKEGGYTLLLFRPGSKWAYSDGSANWLAECLTLAYGRDLAALMYERVFAPLGLSGDDLSWRDNIHRPGELGGIANREIGAGIFASVDALARIGYLYLRCGRWEARQIIPADFVDLVRQPSPAAAGLPVVNDPQDRFGGAPSHYGLLWWNNRDGALADVPRDAFWGYGLGDSLVAAIPSLDIVVARSGSAWPGSRKPSYYRVLAPFLGAIVGALRHGA